jgi:nucleoside-diphosphate-sugar epimerase
MARARTLDFDRDGVTLVEGDLTVPESLEAPCEGIDLVQHIAATYREAGHADSAYWAINVDGSTNLVAAAARQGVRRLVHCSTGGVHGHVERPPANEDSPYGPGDIYQTTKLEAETRVRDFGERNPIEVVVVRPIGIYGPRDTRFLKMFRGIARRRFPILGTGDVYYHLTFIEDLVEGFRLAGETPRAAGRTYLIAGPEYTTLNELTRRIAEELDVAPPRLRLPIWPVWLAGAICEYACAPFGLEPPLYRRRVDFYRKSRAFDISRARAELAYNPTVDLRTGIRRTIAWYREHGWL